MGILLNANTSDTVNVRHCALFVSNFLSYIVILKINVATNAQKCSSKIIILYINNITFEFRFYRWRFTRQL